MGLLLGMMIGMSMGFGLGLVVFALFLFPAGHFGRRDSSKMKEIDQEVATFIRSLGAIAGATKSTLGAALGHMDLRSLGSLAPHVERLHTRVVSQLPMGLSWRRFQAETGNELLRRSSEMLIDGVELGGRPEEIGEIASSYATAVSELREMRVLTSSSFSFLVIPMHAAMTGLLLFILAIITGFNDKLTEVAAELVADGQGSTEALTGAGGLGGFSQAESFGLISGMITFVIIVLTVSNALAAKFASGGSNMKIASQLSVMCLISGINMIIVPTVAGGLISGA